MNFPAFDAPLFLGKVHLMPSKYDPETRAKAVRLVRERREDYPSEWAAITAVSKTSGPMLVANDSGDPVAPCSDDRLPMLSHLI